MPATPPATLAAALDALTRRGSTSSGARPGIARRRCRRAISPGMSMASRWSRRGSARPSCWRCCIESRRVRPDVRRTRRNEARPLDLDSWTMTGSSGRRRRCCRIRASTSAEFVLLPLHDVAPGWRHPVTGEGLPEMIGGCPRISSPNGSGLSVNYMILKGNTLYRGAARRRAATILSYCCCGDSRSPYILHNSGSAAGEVSAWLV